MKLELTVSDEEQMRAWVKDLISGQVQSILRGDLKDILEDSIIKTAYPQTEADLRVLIAQQVKETVRQQLTTAAKGYGTPNFIQEVAREEIIKIVREMFKEGKAP